MATEATVICDSISADGHRVTTFKVKFHRYVLAEFNTHRSLSRNSASSRAIPLSKMLARAAEPAMPVAWPAEQKGMQGGAELSPEVCAEADGVWLDAAGDACLLAQQLGDLGVHKSVANRLLEPFLWHEVIVTGTAWANFFALRCSPLAQPEIRVAAELMYEAYQASTPRLLREGEWHLPLIHDEDWAAEPHPEVLAKVSAARCARVSYLTHEGVRDLAQDVTLYERLTGADPMHSSPLEHVARPEPDNWQEVKIKSTTGGHMTVVLPRYGNMVGWHQLRFDVEVEKEYRAYE